VRVVIGWWCSSAALLSGGGFFSGSFDNDFGLVPRQIQEDVIQAGFAEGETGDHDTGGVESADDLGGDSRPRVNR
jgi:hypothetical protein